MSRKLINCVLIGGLMLVAIAPEASAGTVSLNVRVNASTDDANETTTGTCQTSSAKLDMGTNNNWCGMRFAGVTVPQGAYIISAYVTFTADATNSSTCSLRVYGEANDNSSTFAATSSNISSREKTSAMVSWSSIPSWTSGTNYNSPELRTIVQELVNRSGWASGNSLSILVDKNGTSGSRQAKAYDTSTTLCPLLHIDYVVVANPVAKRLLFVVVNSASLTAEELVRKQILVALGYTVTLASATDSQATFDTYAAANDVAYISETITSSNLNTKLYGKSLGIVCEEPALSDDFAMSATASNPAGTQVNIDSNTHYITSVFSTGLLTITSSSQTLNQFTGTTGTGTLAADLKSLGSISGTPSLCVVELNGKLYDGTRAAGRRVLLPWGASFAASALTADGIVLMSRALAWAGGVVGYWKLDEMTGTTASDSSVNLHNGTLNNLSFDSNRVAIAKVAGGLSFDGTSAYINAPSTADLQLTKAMSMSAWIYGNSWGSGDFANAIIRKGDANPNNYEFAICDGHVNLVLDDYDAYGNRGNTLLNTGQWYHVAATWDGTTVKLYVNGVLDNTPITYNVPVGIDTRDLYIGGRINNTDFFSGMLDDVRLFNYALGADEITLLKTQGANQGIRILHWVETK